MITSLKWFRPSRYQNMSFSRADVALYISYIAGDDPSKYLHRASRMIAISKKNGDILPVKENGRYYRFAEKSK